RHRALHSFPTRRSSDLMADKAKIDPFAHVVDSDHIEIFPTAGVVIHLPTVHVFGQAVPIKFMLLMTVCAVLVAWSMIWLGRKMRSEEHTSELQSRFDLV